MKENKKMGRPTKLIKGRTVKTRMSEIDLLMIDALCAIEDKNRSQAIRDLVKSKYLEMFGTEL